MQFIVTLPPGDGKGPLVPDSLPYWSMKGNGEWRLTVDSDTTARQLLDAMGPPEMANLTPVLGKFGSLNVVVGSDRVLMRRPPGVCGDARARRTQA